MFLKWISFKLIPLVFLNKSSKLCFFFISENCVLHWFMYGVLTISVYKITLLACVLVTLMSCQETSSFFTLAASMCCWWSSFFVYPQDTDWSYQCVLFSNAIFAKKPTTTHPNFENNKYFIVLLKMDIFRNNCLFLRTQNNCLAGTLTPVFSTAPCSHKFKISLWNIFNI